MVEVMCKGCGTALVDGGVDWYCPECDYSEPVKIVLPLKPCCIEAAKAERDRLRKLPDGALKRVADSLIDDALLSLAQGELQVIATALADALESKP